MPAGVQAMSVLGPLAKGLAFLMGKQPEEQRQPRGCLGLEWSEHVASGRKQVLVQGVLEGLPAARGGVHSGDQIVEINDRAIKGLKDAHRLGGRSPRRPGAFRHSPRLGKRYPRSEINGHRWGGTLSHGHANYRDGRMCQAALESVFCQICHEGCRGGPVLGIGRSTGRPLARTASAATITVGGQA